MVSCKLLWFTIIPPLCQFRIGWFQPLLPPSSLLYVKVSLYHEKPFFSGILRREEKICLWEKINSHTTILIFQTLHSKSHFQVTGWKDSDAPWGLQVKVRSRMPQGIYVGFHSCQWEPAQDSWNYPPSTSGKWVQLYLSLIQAPASYLLLFTPNEHFLWKGLEHLMHSGFSRKETFVASFNVHWACWT